jgi:hypothetical protein
MIIALISVSRNKLLTAREGGTRDALRRPSPGLVTYTADPKLSTWAMMCLGLAAARARAAGHETEPQLGLRYATYSEEERREAALLIASPTCG